MTLPKYKSSYLLKPGKYTFRITDPPKKKSFGRATGVILEFSAIDEFGEMQESSCLFWPWTNEYRVLKDEIIQSDEETDWVGRSFLGEIIIGPHPTKPDKEQQNIINIEPLPKADGPLATKEEEPIDTTPPPEEEEDPGPGEEEDPGDDDVPF